MHDRFFTIYIIKYDTLLLYDWVGGGLLKNYEIHNMPYKH